MWHVCTSPWIVRTFTLRADSPEFVQLLSTSCKDAFMRVQRPACCGTVREMLMSSRCRLHHRLTGSLKSTGRSNSSRDIFSVLHSWSCFTCSWEILFVSERAQCILGSDAVIHSSVVSMSWTTWEKEGNMTTQYARVTIYHVGDRDRSGVQDRHE